MRPRSRRKPKSSFWQWNGSGAAAIAGVMVTAAIVAPVRAAVLNTWSFDPATRQLVIALPEGVTPNFFLLAEPARIVVDMPGTALGSIPLEQEYAGAVRSIRFSEILGGSRVVVELAPDTLLDPRHAELVPTDAGNGLTQWTLQPLIQDDASIAPIAAAEPDTATATTPDAPAAPPAPIAQATEESPESVDDSLDDGAEDAPAVPPAESSVADETTAGATEQPDSAPAEEASIPNLPPTPLANDASPSPELPEVAVESTPDTASDASVEAGTEEPAEPIRVTPPEESAVSVPEVPVDEATESGATEPPAGSPSLATTEADGTLSSAETAPTPESPAPAVPEIPARPLPSGPDPLQGVHTDASVLVGAGSEEPSDQLPSNALPATAQPSVSVPSIADVPAPPLPETTSAPPADAVAIPVPPTSEPDESPAIAIAVPEAPALPSEVPASPSAPSTASEAPASSTAPNEIRPPQAGSPTETSPAEVPPPPLANTAEPPLETPPFLASAGDLPTPEQPSIPPPPTGDSSSRVVPFGTPLPTQGKTIEEATLPAGIESVGTIPVGTRLVLQYSGTEPLKLTQSEPWYEVLIVAEDVFHPTTNERLLLKGTQVIGRFEGLDDSERRFVSQVFVEAGGDRRALLAESDWLAGVAQPDGDRVLTNSGIGAAALTILSGFSGIGLLGGAALGAASSFATAPRVVTIEPGQLIRVEVVSDAVPFQDTANATP